MKELFDRINCPKKESLTDSYDVGGRNDILVEKLEEHSFCGMPKKGSTMGIV